MIYTLHFGDILVGEFHSAEGLAGELFSMHGEQGPFLSLANGHVSGPLRQWASESLRWRTGLHENGVLGLKCGDTRSLGALHTGPLEPVVAFGLQPTGGVREIVFRAPNLDPIPQHAQEIWERWSIQAPVSAKQWSMMTTAQRRALLFVTRLVAGSSVSPIRTISDFTIDGRTVQDYPGLFLAIGEAIEGPGGYVGGDLDALADRLNDYAIPASTCLAKWEYSTHARAALASWEWHRHAWRAGIALSPDADLFSAVNSVFEARGLAVVET